MSRVIRMQQQLWFETSLLTHTRSFFLLLDGSYLLKIDTGPFISLAIVDCVY